MQPGTEVQRMNFVDIVDNPVVYITKRESVSAIPRRLIRAIWLAWPVLLLALLLSLLSGVLLWFLVSTVLHNDFISDSVSARGKHILSLGILSSSEISPTI